MYIFFNKLSNILPKDKLMHFIVGLVLILLISLFTTPAIACFIVIGIGIAKELMDELTDKGQPDWQDAIWTGVGGLVGFLALVVR